MSRIGKAPITLPAGVEVKKEGVTVTVKGPKGTLSRQTSADIALKIEGSTLHVENNGKSKDSNAKHGLYRALINNMVVGVNSGFSRSLILYGVGYKAAVSGSKLVLNIGYSHPVEITAPDGIKFECPAVPSGGQQSAEVVVSGIDKELVGHVAANIKAQRVVEPYHAYGIRYKEEPVVIKEGKKAGK